MVGLRRCCYGRGRQVPHRRLPEELYIALALQSSRARTEVHTDSKTSARTFAAALVSKQTANLATKAIRKESRRLFPAPQSITFRQLQTRTYITPAVMHRINPDTPPTCPFWDHAHRNFEHMLWLCPANNLEELATQEAWNKAIMSTKHRRQLRAVQRARDVAASPTASAILGGAPGLAMQVPADLR
ncbi:hypothetical protein HPB50_005919 [Hyalomma asiaticum]|uniref:Uncharacterized protein n=1 Tax=Hyalomma asiaticum TaxID=266040 RepID=A0ACB7T5S0_HYAAI|nr:hypothetical protein HPB50_005919 [Hyalomma asiaticum]